MTGIETILALETVAKKADANVIGVALLKPDRASEPGWFVYQRADGQRVRIDTATGAAPSAAAVAALTGLDLTTTGLNTIDIAQQRAAAADFLTLSTRSTARVCRACVAVMTTEVNAVRAANLIGSASITWNPSSLLLNTGVTSPDIDVPGAAFGDIVEPVAGYDLAGVTVTAYVKAAGKVSIRLQNTTGVIYDPPQATWTVYVRRPAALTPRAYADLFNAVLAAVAAG